MTEDELESQIESELSAMQKLIGKLEDANEKLESISSDVDNLEDVKQ